MNASLRKNKIFPNKQQKTYRILYVYSLQKLTELPSKCNNVLNVLHIFIQEFLEFYDKKGQNNN